MKPNFDNFQILVRTQEEKRGAVRFLESLGCVCRDRSIKDGVDLKYCYIFCASDNSICADQVPCFHKRMTVQQKLQRLSIDTSFGILTRQALEITIEENGLSGTLYLLDFNNIHRLNKQFGYNTVNERFRKVFYTLIQKFPHILIGRVFSGDEIAIVTYEPYSCSFVSEISKLCDSQGLGFKFIHSLFLKQDDFGRFLDNVAEKLRNSSCLQSL